MEAGGRAVPLAGQVEDSTSFLSLGAFFFFFEVEVCESVTCSVMSDSLQPVECSPPGSSVHGILQARILEQVATPFSTNLPDAGTGPGSPASQADSSPSEAPGKW